MPSRPPPSRPPATTTDRNMPRTLSLSSSSSSSRDHGLRYKGRLPASEVPELVDLCEQFVTSKNVTGLAMIARQRGLPPSMRCKIWPVLLKYHPYVQHPYIEPDLGDSEDEDEAGEGDDEPTPAPPASREIPVKDIRYDLRKYLRNAERYKPKTMTPDLVDLFEIQDRMFDAIEHAIVKFVRKWRKIIRYSPGLAWIALGLAEWVPPLEDSEFVLCGRDDIAKNGTKLRNVNDNYFERCDTYSADYSTSNTASTVDSTPTISRSPGSVTSLGSSASQTAYDSGTSRQSSKPDLIYPFKPMTFAEVYERMVLTILHTPDPDDRRKTGGTSTSSSSSSYKKRDSIKHRNSRSSTNSDGSESTTDLEELPKFGGSVEDRISFFFFGMRKLMPDLYSYMSDEDCLKGDWILWWLKYCGSKVWSRYDRGRTWDLLLGFRVNCNHFERDLPLLCSLSEQQLRLFGPDSFWYPQMEDLSVNNGYSGTTTNDTNGAGGANGVHYRPFRHTRSSSILTLLNQVSVGQQPCDLTPTFESLTLADGDNSDVAPLPQLPFSVIDPHIQMVFVSLAFLKAKEFTIMELDQSEIIQLFNRLSSLKTSEIRSFVSPDEASTDQHYHPVRKSNRDIENIILEAGELWRKFIYTEMTDENS